MWIPSFGYAVSYVIASKHRDPASLGEDEVDETLRRNRVEGLKIYSGRTHEGLMKTPVLI